MVLKIVVRRKPGVILSRFGSADVSRHPMIITELAEVSLMFAEKRYGLPN